MMEEHKQSETISHVTTTPTTILNTPTPLPPRLPQPHPLMSAAVSSGGMIGQHLRDHPMNHIIPLGIINTTIQNKSATNLRSGNVVPIPPTSSSTTSTASTRPPPSSTTTTPTAAASRLPPSTIQFTHNSTVGTNFHPTTNGTLPASGVATTGTRSQLPRHTTTSITNHASSSFSASSTSANVASSTTSFVAAAAAAPTRHTGNLNGAPSIPSVSRLSVSPPPTTDPDLLRIKSSLVQNDELYHKIRDGEEERRILAQRLHEVESHLRDSIERERLLEEERDVIGRNELKLNQETGQLKVKLDAAQTELNRLLNVIVPDMQAQLAAALKPAPPPVPSASPVAAPSPATAADAWLPSRHDFDRVLAARGLAEQKVALLQQQLEASGREKEEWKSRFSAMREKNRKTQELLATAHGLLNDDIKIQEKYAQDHALTLSQARRIKQLEKDLQDRDETVEKLKEELAKAQSAAAQTPTPARVTRATTHIVSPTPTAAPKRRGRPKKNVSGAVVAAIAPTDLEQLLEEEKQSHEATSSNDEQRALGSTAAVVPVVTSATALPKRRGRPPKSVQPPTDDDQAPLSNSTATAAASAASTSERPTKRAKYATARTDAERLELELFGDNSDQDLTADATSATSAAASSSSSSSISTNDQIHVLVDSITAEWMDRITFLQENTVTIDEHPIRLILPVLCGYSTSAEWDPRSVHAATGFKICVTQLPHFFLVLFRSLMVALASATEGVQEERELVVLNAEASTLVESLGTQFPAIIEMLQTIVEQMSSTSGEQPMEIDADLGDIASSAQTASSSSSSRTCSCRTGSPIDLLSSFTESIYSTFIQCKHPTPLSIEAAILECGYLTFLLESTNAADTQITLFMDILCRLIYIRPILPLHLIEHGLNTLPAHMTPAFQPDYFVHIQCDHPRPRTSMESSIGEQLLPSPTICDDCIKSTSAISILSLAFHTILTQVLSPYPFEMLEMRLPHLNRFLSTKIVQSLPSMPEAPSSSISEQLLVFVLAGLDTILLPSSSESNLVPASSGEVNQLVQAFLLLLASFGMEQSEFILNHIIRPKYNQSTEMIRTLNARVTSAAAADSMNDAAATNDHQDQRQRVHQLWRKIYLEATQLVLKQAL